MTAEEHQALKFPFGDPAGLTIDPLFDRLRTHQPIARIRLPYGGEGWLVTTYEDNRVLLTDRRFIRSTAVGPDVPRLTAEPAGGSAMSLMDPPAHTRLRRLVATAFTVRRVSGLRPFVLRLVDELLTDMAEQGPPADLIESFALPLPMRVICELLGVPYADRHRFAQLAAALLSSTAYTREQVRDAADQLSDYLADLIDERRAHPTDDLLSALVRARDEDDRLSEQELVTLCGTLLSAGYENVANAIANFTYLLLTDAGPLRVLRAEPSLLPAAVEEMLRYVMSGLGASHPRIATEDVILSGVLISEGDAVFASLPAANHDAGVFPRPDVIDFKRGHNPHLAFGHGVHHCLGAQLARMELVTALDGLLRRFPDLRLAMAPQDVTWKAGLTVRGPISLRVSW